MNFVSPISSSSVGVLPFLARMAENSSQMRDHLKNNDIEKAISSARLMLMNLREELPFSLYLAVYRKATAELSFFCEALQRLNEKQKKERQIKSLCAHSLHSFSYYAEVYELVEGIGHVIPRVYLLIAVGSLLMQEKPLPKRVNLKNDSDTSADVQKAPSETALCLSSSLFTDVKDPDTHHRSEMERSRKKLDLCMWSLSIFRELLLVCRGVAHPIRGLFLRHFLLSVIRLPFPGEVNRESSSPSPKQETLLKLPLSAEASSGSMTSMGAEKGFMATSGMGSASSMHIFANDVFFQYALLLVENLEEVFCSLNSFLKYSTQHDGGTSSSPAHGVLGGKVEEEKMFINLALKRLAAAVKMVSVDDYCSKLFPRLLRAVERNPEPFFQCNVLLFFITQFPAAFHFHTITSWIRFLLCSMPSSVHKSRLWKRLLLAVEPFFSSSDQNGPSEGKEGGAEQGSDVVPSAMPCKALEAPSPAVPQTTVLDNISHVEESSGNKTMEGAPPVPLTIPSDEGCSCSAEFQEKERNDIVITPDEAYSLFALIVETIGTLLPNAAATTPETTSQENLVDSSEGRHRQSETLKDLQCETDGSEETMTSVVAPEAAKDPHEKKKENTNPESEEGRAHTLKALFPPTQETISLETLFEFLDVLVQFSSRLPGAGGPAGDRRLTLLFELLHRHPLSEEKNREKVRLGDRAEAFFWRVALNVAELESFCRLRGIIPLLDALPHTFRHRLALLLCSKVSSEGDKATRKVELPSISPRSVANEHKKYFLRQCNDTLSHSGTKVFSSSSSGMNHRNVKSGIDTGKINDGKGGNCEDKSGCSGQTDFHFILEKKSFFYTVEGIRIFLGFTVDAFVLSAQMWNENEKKSSAIVLQETIWEEKRALCQVISSIYHEDRTVFLEMILAVQQVIEPLSYAFDPYILNTLSIKLQDVASPSHAFFALPKHRQGGVQVATALSTVIAAVASTTISNDTSSSLTALGQKRPCNPLGIGEKVAESTSGREWHSAAMGESKSTFTSKPTLSLPSVSSKKESEADIVCYPPFTSSCSPMDIVSRVLNELYSSGEGKGLLERLGLLNGPLGCARYIDAALLADYYQMGEMVDTFLTEASQLQDNFSEENAAIEFLTRLVDVLNTPLSSLSKEHYERIILSVTRQCSLLQRKDQQSRMLALCSALHCLPPIISEEMISKGKLCFDRAQKIGFVVPPLTRLPLMLDLLEMSMQLFYRAIPVVTQKTLADQVKEIRKQIKDQSAAGVGNTPLHMDPIDSRKPRERHQEIESMKWLENVEKRFDIIAQRMKDQSTKDPRYEEILEEFIV